MPDRAALSRRILLTVERRAQEGRITRQTGPPRDGFPGAGGAGAVRDAPGARASTRGGGEAPGRQRS